MLAETEEESQKENSPESESDEQSLSEVEGGEEEMVSRARVAELEGLVAQKDEELAKVNACIAELEEALVTKDSDIAALEQAQVELEERLSTVGESLADATANYKAVVIEANPGVMEELISGDTIEAIDESLKKAKDLVGKVRQGLETEISLTRVPAGAPERRAPDLSALSPSEKIQYAMGGRR